MSSLPIDKPMDNCFGWEGPVPPLVQQAWEAWNNHQPRRIDYSSKFVGLELASQTLVEMADETRIKPGNNVLKHIIMDIVTNPNKISSIKRDMFVESGGPNRINTSIVKKYNITSSLCFGNMDIYAKYYYKPDKVDLFMMEVNFSQSALDEPNWFDYIQGDERLSKPRKENKVLMILLPEIFDKLYDDRTKTKTPEFKDFVESELTRHYTNMKNYCAELHQRISGVEIAPKASRNQNCIYESLEPRDDNVLIYFDAQRTRELATDVINVLRKRSVRITSEKDNLGTWWYYAYISDNPECIIRVFYNIFENYYNSAVVDLYYQDEHITGKIPPGFNIDQETNALTLKRLIRMLNRRARMNKIALLLGAGNQKK